MKERIAIWNELVSVDPPLDEGSVVDRVILAVLWDLTGRSGLDHSWDSIDDETQAEIITTLRKKVAATMKPPAEKTEARPCAWQEQEGEPRCGAPGVAWLFGWQPCERHLAHCIQTAGGQLVEGVHYKRFATGKRS